MKNIRIFILTICLFVVALATAQTRGVADNAIPGDNTMRYYRLALPVTLSAYKQDLGGNYNNVLSFWRECEDFANRMFVPLGICFDVVEDARLVMPSYNLIDENIYNTSFGTELTDAAIGSANYDVGMWVHHRDEFAENSGLSVGNGVYKSSTKSSGYAKTDKWVVAHELGHMFGADFHTAQGEGSLMDEKGEFFSYPSLLLIREESVKNGVGSANVNKNVTNSAPQFTSAMYDTYRIPQGACVAIPVSATDDEGHLLTYSAIGCSSTNVGNVNGENGVLPDFKSLIPQTSNIIDYSPKYSADINNASYYYEITGTNIPSMAAGSYSIAFLVNDMPSSTAYDYLLENPFYSNYAVWDANIEIVGGTTPFDASLSPKKDSYSAGEPVTVKWGVNHSYFTTESRVRITMSTNYGESFDYVLAESVPATDGSCVVTLPNVNVGNVDVDFITAVRSMRGGIIRVEEIGGIAYTLTTLTPANGGGFTVTGGGDVPPAVNTYKITVASNVAGGLAFINNNGVTEGNYSEGTKIKLSAVEDVDKSGYLFNGWYKNGKLVSTDEYCEIVVNESAHYEARFEKGCVIQALDRTRICQVTISDTNKKEGTGRLVVRSGEKVTMSVVVDPYYKGYVFLGWCNVDGEVLSNDLNYVVTVTEDVIYYAVAELAHYTLKVSTPDKNMGSVQAISGTFEWAEEVEVGYNTFAMLSAIPNDGYVFVNWTKDGVVVATEQEYRVSEITDLNAMVDVEYVAHFMEETEKRYSVSAEVNPFTAGFVSFSKKDIEYGGSVTLTASANEGYVFENWTLDGEVVGSEKELVVNNVTTDLSYVANYRVTDPLTGRWFRLKEKNSALYLDVDHDGADNQSAYGQVKISNKNKESEKQIVLFEKSGAGYTLKSKSGYYIKGEAWNVDATTDAKSAAVLMFEDAGNVSEFYIKWNNVNNGGALQYFKVQTADGDNSGIQYVYCDAPEKLRATWILEEVADKSKLQALIAETTELFNTVATEKTKINIAGKITSNAGHNTADGNGYADDGSNRVDGGGIAALTDENPETYFHSRWGGTAVNEAHYLQINLDESESMKDFCFEYAVRKTGNSNQTSPAPTAIEIRVSADGINFGAPVATYTSGTHSNSLPSYADLGQTLWLSDVISAQNDIRYIRLTVTKSAGPGGNKWNNQYFFAMGTLNLYSPIPALKEEYKEYPAITENMLLDLKTALATANNVNNNDVATIEEVNEAILTLRAQKEALENALIPVSFTLAQVTAGNLMEKTEPTYIAVKNISGSNNRWFAGTRNAEEFNNLTVLVWEPVVEGQKGSYYIRNTYGKYIQNTSPITFGTVEGAAVFTAKNATTKGSGDTYFNGDNNDANTLANINTPDDPDLVRFVTGTQWINVEHANTNQPSIRNGNGGYTVHYVYEATMVSEFAVNVTDAQFATFYAPVNVVLPDNAKIYIINSVKEKIWAHLEEVEGEVLAKNTAVLVYSENPVECNFSVTAEDADVNVDGNKLVGTVNDAYIKKNSENSYYILAKKDGIVAMYNPVLGKVEDKFKNRANRAYLVLDKNDIPQQTAGLRFLFPGSTAIEDIVPDNVVVETIYDLQGRKLTEITLPGIYIVNGKKVIFK